MDGESNGDEIIFHYFYWAIWFVESHGLVYLSLLVSCRLWLFWRSFQLYGSLGVYDSLVQNDSLLDNGSVKNFGSLLYNDSLSTAKFSHGPRLAFYARFFHRPRLTPTTLRLAVVICSPLTK